MPFPKVFVSDVKAAQRHACNVNKGNKQSQQSWRLSTESFNGAQKKALRGEKFGGAPADLPTTDLPTNSDVARYFYLLSSQEKDYKTQIDLVRQKLNDVWSKCNTRLPVIEEKSLHTKIKRFLDKVKQLNAGKLIVSLALNVQKTKDKLFDIAACNCSLQTHPCDSKVVRCSIENCEKEHIICECPNDRRIPAEERSYMRDQRAKVGTRGAYQMGTKERSRAVKKKWAPAEAPLDHGSGFSNWSRSLSTLTWVLRRVHYCMLYRYLTTVSGSGSIIYLLSGFGSLLFCIKYQKMLHI